MLPVILIRKVGYPWEGASRSRRWRTGRTAGLLLNLLSSARNRNFRLRSAGAGEGAPVATIEIRRPRGGPGRLQRVRVLVDDADPVNLGRAGASHRVTVAPGRHTVRVTSWLMRPAELVVDVAGPDAAARIDVTMPVLSARLRVAQVG